MLLLQTGSPMHSRFSHVLIQVQVHVSFIHTSLGSYCLCRIVFHLFVNFVVHRAHVIVCISPLHFFRTANDEMLGRAWEQG